MTVAQTHKCTRNHLHGRLKGVNCTSAEPLWKNTARGKDAWGTAGQQRLDGSCQLQLL